jgi:hypothetical protein
VCSGSRTGRSARTAREATAADHLGRVKAEPGQASTGRRPGAPAGEVALPWWVYARPSSTSPAAAIGVDEHPRDEALGLHGGRSARVTQGCTDRRVNCATSAATPGCAHAAP